MDVVKTGDKVWRDEARAGEQTNTRGCGNGWKQKDKAGENRESTEERGARGGKTRSKERAKRQGWYEKAYWREEGKPDETV